MSLGDKMAQNLSDSKCDTLSSIFKKLIIGYEFLESTDLATLDPGYQLKVTQCIPEAEKAVHKVNLLHLFSDNEDIEEVTTNSLKFILLPALLGYFTMKQIEGERLEIVQKGKAYFKDFMRLCSLYKLTSVRLEENSEEEQGTSSEVTSSEVTISSNSDINSDTNLTEMANQRQGKIERYKEQKNIIAELKELRTHVEKSHVEEEVERKYYMLLIKHWINKVIDEYDNIKFELQILEQRPHLTHCHQRQSKERSQKKPFRPFIITKDQLQKKVLGAGYPSLPTLTIEEFYDQKIKEGTLQIPTSGQSLRDWAADSEDKPSTEDKEDSKADGNVDKDDPEALAKARAWDDWRDDVRRGDGNRHNMG